MDKIKTMNLSERATNSTHPLPMRNASMSAIRGNYTSILSTYPPFFHLTKKTFFPISPQTVLSQMSWEQMSPDDEVETDDFPGGEHVLQKRSAAGWLVARGAASLIGAGSTAGAVAKTVVPAITSRLSPLATLAGKVNWQTAKTVGGHLAMNTAALGATYYLQTTLSDNFKDMHVGSFLVIPLYSRSIFHALLCRTR